MVNALLFSASRYLETEYLEHTKVHMQEFFSDKQNIIFLPFANVMNTPEQLRQKVSDALGLNLRLIEDFGDAKAAIKAADGVLCSGGNTFMLLKTLYELDILNLLSSRAKSDLAYAGWSAGSNIAGKRILTTNDMPITHVPSFDALRLCEFLINPHFTDLTIDKFNGESREKRLFECLAVNPNEKIIALEEGSALRIKGDKCQIIGQADAWIFKAPKSRNRLSAGEFCYADV